MAATKTKSARSRAKTTAKPLGGMEDELGPQEVQDSVNAYTAALKKKGKATKAANTVKDATIELMAKHELRRVRYADEKGNWKYLKRKSTDSLLIETPKDEPAEDE